MKGAIQNLMGDNAGAAETLIELQLEQMDGGVPGNAVAAELGEQIVKLGDDAIDLIATYGDEVTPLLLKFSDETIPLLKKGTPSAQSWKAYIPEDLYDDIISAFDGEPVAVVLN